MLFSLASRILNHKEFFMSKNKAAKTYLQTFFRILPTLYGENSQSINFHNLIHIADDAFNLNLPLSDCTAFPFESFMGKLKQLINSPNKPLEQILNHLDAAESHFDLQMTPKAHLRKIYPDKGHHPFRFSRVDMRDFTITTQHPNNAVQLENDVYFEISKIESMTKDPQKIEDLIISGQIINKKNKNVFCYPENSSVHGIYEVEKHRVEEPFEQAKSAENSSS